MSGDWTSLCPCDMLWGMGRRRHAWLMNKSGHRVKNGRRMPGFTVQWVDPETGRRCTRTFSTSRAARTLRDAKNDQFDRLGMGALAPRTFHEAAIEFTRSCRLLAEGTQGSYAQSLGLLGRQVGFDRPVSDVTAADLDHFLMGRRVSESTLAKHYRTFRRFFR